MKKTILILVFLTCFIINGYTQDCGCGQCPTQGRRTIRVRIAGGWDNRGEAIYPYISFNSDGSTISDGYLHYRNYGNNEMLTGMLTGTYYIDNNNVVNIRWENGFQETIQLQYDDNGKIFCIFRGYRLIERGGR